MVLAITAFFSCVNVSNFLRVLLLSVCNLFVVQHLVGMFFFFQSATFVSKNVFTKRDMEMGFLSPLLELCKFYLMKVEPSSLSLCDV